MLPHGVLSPVVCIPLSVRFSKLASAKRDIHMEILNAKASPLVYKTPEIQSEYYMGEKKKEKGVEKKKKKIAKYIRRKNYKIFQPTALHDL